MKKIIIVVTLALSLLFSVGFVSCENNDQTNSSVTSTTSDSLNNNGSSSSKNSEEVEQAKNEKQNLLSEYYVQNTKELTAEQKLTAEISYNFVLQQLNNFRGTVDELNAKYNEIYLKLQESVNLIKSTASTLAEIKDKAKKELELIYNSVLAYANNSQAQLSALYDSVLEQIENATEDSKSQITNAVTEFKSYIYEYVKNVITLTTEDIKTLANNALNVLEKKALKQLENYEDLKNNIITFYEEQKEKINSYNEQEIKELISDTISSVKGKLEEVIKEKINEFKQEVILKINILYNSTIDKISDEEIKNELDKAYNISLTNLNSVTDLDSAQTALKSIVDNFTTATKNIINKVLNKFIEKYKGELKVIYDNVSKPLSTDVKTELEKLYNNAVLGFENAETKEDLINVLNTFKNDAKTYVVESLNEIFIKMGSKPDVWAYLPTAFKPENRIVATSTLPTYEDFTDISTIPTNYIGKQLNVVYTVFNKTDVALNYVNKVYDVLNKVGEMYNSIFENSDGENIVLNAGEFNLTLILTQTKYEISTKISGVELYVYSNLTTNDFGARIQLSESNIIKYNVTDSSIKMAYSILNSSICQVTLEKDSSNNVVGYIYETLGLGETEIKSTSAYLTVKDGYTTVVGNKGDFIPTSGGINCEVYENSTGNYVGSEVSETFKSNQYDTLWYNLKDIGGITTIKKIDEANRVNPDTIYINGSNESIHSMLVSLTNPSRRFDIEFKTVYAFTYNAETEEYEIVEFEVPMMFIQESQEETFATDFENKNTKSVETDSISIKSTDEAKNAIKYGYHTLVENYKEIKDSVSYQSIIDYCNE